MTEPKLSEFTLVLMPSTFTRKAVLTLQTPPDKAFIVAFVNL